MISIVRFHRKRTTLYPNHPYIQTSWKFEYEFYCSTKILSYCNIQLNLCSLSDQKEGMSAYDDSVIHSIYNLLPHPLVDHMIADHDNDWPC